MKKVWKWGSVVLVLCLAMLPFLKGSSNEVQSRLTLMETSGQLSGELRGVEYFEYLVVYRNYASFKSAVYNTIRTKPIEIADWNAVDVKSLAKELDAFKVIKNGPRFWTLDHVQGYRIGERRDFDGYDLDLMGVLDLSLVDLFNRAAYTERTIERYTDFHFNKGSKMFVLTSDQGVEYFMQAASKEVDSTMSMIKLETLGDRLDLPDGWTYTVVELTQDVMIQARGSATVIQDEFLNTYQRKD